MAYFAASCDSAEENKAFAKSLDLNYAILSDPGKQVAHAFGVVGLTRPLPRRWTFFIGTDGKILAIDKKVKPGSHGADVVARLEELGVAKKKLDQTDPGSSNRGA